MLGAHASFLCLSVETIKKGENFSEDLFFSFLFFRDHTKSNPMRKKGKLLVKTFFRVIL